MIETNLEGVMSARAQEIRAGLAWLHAADPVLAQVIDERPDFDPDVWIRRLPAMGLFGALVFQIIGFPNHRPADLSDRGDRDFRPSHRAVRRPGTGCWRARGCRPGDIA